MFQQIFAIMFGWLPNNALRVVFAGLVAILVVFILFRLVKVILDSLPFL